MVIGDHKPEARRTALFETAEEFTVERVVFAVAHLQPQEMRLSSIFTPMATRTTLERTWSVLPGRPYRYVARDKVQVAAPIKRALQKRPDLCIEPVADAAEHRARDSGLVADGDH